MVKEIKELNKEVVDKENEIMEENKETTIKWENLILTEISVLNI